MIQRIISIIKNKFTKPTEPCFIEQNVGEKVIEWPERIILALQTLDKWLDKNNNYKIADFGSGQQTLKKHINPQWHYTPFDYYKRTEDTVLINFNEQLPTTPFDIIFCLGVFEYLENPYNLLESIINNSKIAVISYTGLTTNEKRTVNGWKNLLSLEELEKKMEELGAQHLEKVHYVKNQWIYIIKGKL